MVDHRQKRTEREAEILLGRMPLDELRETERLVQAEIRRRESKSFKPIQAWDNRTTRHA